jgi:hypothetical protein
MFDEDELNAAEREVEAALKSLRPMPARIDLGATVVRSGHSTGGRLRLWVVAATAAAVLLGGGAWLVLRPSGEKAGDGEQRVAANDAGDSAVSEVAVEPPTLLVYRRALARSSAELDAVLDRQARASTSSQNVGVTLTAWNADLHPSLGDM